MSTCQLDFLFFNQTRLLKLVVKFKIKVHVSNPIKVVEGVQVTIEGPIMWGSSQEKYNVLWLNHNFLKKQKQK